MTGASPPWNGDASSNGTRNATAPVLSMKVGFEQFETFASPCPAAASAARQRHARQQPFNARPRVARTEGFRVRPALTPRMLQSPCPADKDYAETPGAAPVAVKRDPGKACARPHGKAAGAKWLLTTGRRRAKILTRPNPPTRFTSCTPDARGGRPGRLLCAHGRRKGGRDGGSN